MKTIFILLFSLFLAACGNDSDLSGTYYLARTPASTVTFKENQTIEVFAAGAKTTTVYKYVKNGNVISFGALTFKQLDDGALMLNGVDKYIKK